MRSSLTILLLTALCCAPASAFQLVSTDAYTLAPGASATNELVISSANVTISGTSDDDLFIMATQADLDGRFNADVWAMADVLTFAGKAGDDIRLFGRDIKVTGSLDGSLTAIGNSVVVSNGSVIRGSAVLVGETVISEGDVRGSLRMAGSSATISGRIRGSVRVAAEDIVVMPGTEIDGDLVYSSSEDLFLDKSVKLQGQLVRKNVDAFASWSKPKPTISEIATVQSFFYVCAMLAALPFMALFPRFTGLAVRQARQRIWFSLAIGIAAVSLAPLAAILLLVTIIGIPLAILIACFYAVLLYLAKVPVALVIGGMLLRRRGPQPFSRVFTALSTGLLILYTVGALPVIGGPVRLLTLFLGVGALLSAIFASQLSRDAALRPPPLEPSSPPDLTSTETNERPPERKE